METVMTPAFPQNPSDTAVVAGEAAASAVGDTVVIVVIVLSRLFAKALALGRNQRLWNPGPDESNGPFP